MDSFTEFFNFQNFDIFRPQTLHQYINRIKNQYIGIVKSIPTINIILQVQLTEFHTLAINKRKLKDGHKGKELAQNWKKIKESVDIEKTFKQLSDQTEIDIEELYNITNHLKWWKMGTYVYKLDQFSYFR
jgi:hypothetical protein